MHTFLKVVAIGGGCIIGLVILLFILFWRQIDKNGWNN